MKIALRGTLSVMAGAVFLMCQSLLSGQSDATSLRGIGSVHEEAPSSSSKGTTTTKQHIIGQYTITCANQPAKGESCDKLKKEAVEILKEDLHTLGSSANRTYLPAVLGIFKSDEPALRIAAADALGMIGPQDQDVEALAAPANDPVPDVRRAVSQAISRGKGPGLKLLGDRVMSFQKTGLAPEVLPDAGKFAMPVAPDTTYLFDSSDATKGRLSYVAKGQTDPTQFFKDKAKKGPIKWDQFKEQYRFQLKDEEEAMDQAQQKAGKRLESEKPPDPTNMEAYMEYMQKMASVSMQGSMGRTYFDNYQASLYGAPTVYVLEERQIGQRSYPTRYVVVYQELAFKRPGYRLAWMTVPDSAIKTAQATSLAQEKEELANKKEAEVLKKRQEALEDLTKKKDAAEKKQFKKGQEDLEKELGF